MSNKVDEILQGIRDATTSGSIVWRRVDNDMFYSDSLTNEHGARVRVSLRHEVDKDALLLHARMLNRGLGATANVLRNLQHHIVLRLVELDEEDNPSKTLAQLDTKSLPDFEEDFKQLSKAVQAQVELSSEDAEAVLKLFNRGA